MNPRCAERVTDRTDKKSIRFANPLAMDMTNTTVTRRVRSWRSIVLKHLRRGSSLSFAAKAAGISRQHVYLCMSRDEGFRAEVKDAIDDGIDRIEDVVLKLALKGLRKPMFYRGRQVFVGYDEFGNYCPLDSPALVKKVPFFSRRPSTKLLIFLLQARRPEKFRARTICPKCGGKLYEPESDPNRVDFG